jgi:hypothetical protein
MDPFKRELYYNQELTDIQHIDVTPDMLPKGWLFMLYTPMMSEGIYGIYENYSDAMCHMKKCVENDIKWSADSSEIRLILIDPKWPIPLWGYAGLKPTYITLAIEKEDFTISLMFEDNLDSYVSADMTTMRVFSHRIFFEQDWIYKDGITEDDNHVVLLFGHTFDDAVKCAYNYLFEDRNIPDYADPNDKIEAMSLYKGDKPEGFSLNGIIEWKLHTSHKGRKWITPYIF